MTWTETWLKFDSSPALMMGSNDSKEGGDRGVLVTDHRDIVDLMIWF